MTNNSADLAAGLRNPSTDYSAIRRFSAAPDVVYNAVTTTAGLTQWWSAASGSGGMGGELVFTFGSAKKIMDVIAADRPTHVRWFVRVCEPLPEWVGTHIDFVITADNDSESVLHFTHEGLTPQLDCFDTCNNAWGVFLNSLVAYVETGRGQPYATA